MGALLEQLEALAALLQPWAWLLAPVSLGLMGVSFAILPWVLVQMPVDYLVNRRAHIRVGRAEHPIARRVLAVVQTGLGVFLIGAGIAMLVLPGQGLLALLAGLLLLRFPGKRRVVAALLLRGGIRRGVDALRARFGHGPLILPPRRQDAED